MNKIFITGLSNSTDLGLCKACNFDFDWLYSYPSTLVSLDKMLVSNSIWRTIIKSRFSSNPVFNKSLKLIFEMAENEDLVEKIDVKKQITSATKEIIIQEAEKDTNKIVENFSEKCKVENIGENSFITIDGFKYCIPQIFSIYVSLLLSKIHNAQCMFSSPQVNYCAYKSKINSDPIHNKAQAFQAIFSIYLPNIPLLPDFTFKKKCQFCSKSNACNDSFLLKLEKDLEKIFKWRKYDEIQQMKNIVNRIIKKSNDPSGKFNLNEIIREFKSEERKLQKLIYSTFPKIQRFTNVITMISIPFALLGLTTPSSILPPATALAASKMTKEAIKLLTNKHRWVSFVNENHFKL